MSTCPYCNTEKVNHWSDWLPSCCLKGYYGGIPLEELTKEDIDEYINYVRYVKEDYVIEEELMKTLTLHELSLEDRPEDGLPIIYFDSQSSFGMFEQHYTKQGVAEYMYGDIADSLEEALEKGGYICLTWKGVDEEDDYMIPLMCGDTYLREGCLWMYEHEYYPVLDPDHFPFQDWYYYNWGLDNKHFNIVDRVTEEANHPAEGRLQFLTDQVSYNGKGIEVQWIQYEGKEPHMIRYMSK